MIALRGVCKSYGSKQVVHDASFDIPKGSVCGLIGHNGAGKTTLMKILSGLIRPDSGEVKIDGMDLSENLSALRGLIGYVPQKTSLYPQMSALENLRFFGAVRGLEGIELSKSIDFCVETAQLDEYLDIRASSYSGGLLKRLNLAIGLLGNPKILYLDEPTVGVDPHSREMMLSVLSMLRDEKETTILYTSHYLEEVEKICDRIVVVDHGKIVGNDLSENLLAKFRTLQIVLNRALDEAVILKLESVDGVSVDANRIVILQESVMVSLPKVFVLISQQSALIERIFYGSGSLEQFLEQSMRSHKAA